MDHDAAWKRLFGLPILVEHLLRGFVAPAAQWLDFGSLRELSASWVDTDSQQRHGDAVWRIDYGDQSGRSLVVLLEFQSTVDREMASRVLRYAWMAHDELIRQGETDADGELRLLPVVLHSGSRTWNAPGAATEISATDKGELLLPLPYSYLSLDVRRLAQHHLPSRNIVSTIFELDALASPAGIVPHIRALSKWQPREVGADTSELVLGTIMEWLASMAPSMFPDSGAAATVSELQRDLQEQENSMALLAERAKQWEAEWLRQGIEQGLEQGFEQGIEQGIGQGLVQERALLCRLAERKFDTTTAEQLARRLAEVTDAQRLAEVGCWIIDCATGAELLAKTNNE